MKLWVFNILVASALAYLFLGESEQSRVKSDLEWAKGKVETTIDNSRSGEAKQIDRDEALVQPQPATAVHTEPKAVIEQRTETGDPSVARQTEISLPRATKKPVPTAPEPLEAPQAAIVAEQPLSDNELDRGETVPTGDAQPWEVAKENLLPLDDPEVARRRAVVLDVEEPITAIDADVHGTAMAAREQRNALNALAEDMELMFTDKTSR